MKFCIYMYLKKIVFMLILALVQCYEDAYPNPGEILNYFFNIVHVFMLILAVVHRYEDVLASTCALNVLFIITIIQ